MAFWFIPDYNNVFLVSFLSVETIYDEKATTTLSEEISEIEKSK